MLTEAGGIRWSEVDRSKIKSHLVQAGWKPKRGGQNSPHEKFEHPDRPGEHLALPRHRQLNPITAFKIMKQAGLVEQFIAESYISEATPAWTRKEGKNPEGGLNRKGIMSYRAANPGSKLSMAVTTPPSKLKPGSKAAKRRKSFCARMSGMKGPMRKPNGKPTRKALALRKWNC